MQPTCSDIWLEGELVGGKAYYGHAANHVLLALTSRSVYVRQEDYGWEESGFCQSMMSRVKLANKLCGGPKHVNKIPGRRRRDHAL